MKHFGHIGAGLAMLFGVASHAPDAAAGPVVNDGMVNLKTACADLGTLDARARCAESLVMVAETLSVMADEEANMPVIRRAKQNGEEWLFAGPPSALRRFSYAAIKDACEDIGTMTVKEGSQTTSVDLADGTLEGLNTLAGRAITCGDQAKGKSMFFLPVAAHLQKHAERVLVRTTPPAPPVKFEAFTFSP